ncbi:MAG: hypothetical protein PHN80_14045 [Hespellia sp.]|nr:hypothetical protein [Hespellia sp.]
MGKLQTEWQKLKGMSLGEKAEYIWMYYKSWFVGALAVIALIYLGITMYHGIQTNVLLNVAVVGGNSQNTTAFVGLENEIKEELQADGKYDKVRIQANIPEDGGSVSSQTALTTLIGADSVDILICPEEIYEEYHAQRGFENLETYLTEKESKISGHLVNENALVFEGEKNVEELFGVAYDKIYITVMVNQQHSQGAKAFFEVLENRIS